jgi:hypothetical protein
MTRRSSLAATSVELASYSTLCWTTICQDTAAGFAHGILAAVLIYRLYTLWHGPSRRPDSIEQEQPLDEDSD